MGIPSSYITLIIYPSVSFPHSLFSLSPTSLFFLSPRFSTCISKELGELKKKVRSWFQFRFSFSFFDLSLSPVFHFVSFRSVFHFRFSDFSFFIYFFDFLFSDFCFLIFVFRFSLSFFLFRFSFFRFSFFVLFFIFRFVFISGVFIFVFVFIFCFCFCWEDPQQKIQLISDFNWFIRTRRQECNNQRNPFFQD